MNTELLNEISENLQRGKAKIVKELVQKAVDEGIEPAVILNEGLLAGMNVIGEKFKTNEVYVPEVLVAARAMNMGVGVLKPLLAEAGVQAAGRVCIGTVQGDLHDIGKNLVASLMEGGGFEVNDLGVDVAPERFVEEAKKHDKTVVCLSALLTTTMPQMKATIEALKEAGLRDKTIVMVGGAPVTQQFADEIGADAYTLNASSAVQKAKELVTK